MKSSTRKIVLPALMATVVAACGQRGNSVDEGEVQLTITTVPVDVQCIMLTASNGDSVAVRGFDVMPQQAANVYASGLPTGTVTLTEVAYDATCDFVTPQTPPSWVSKAPVVAQLQPGQVVAINIELVRPGSVSITNTFADNAAMDGGTDAPKPAYDGSLDHSMPSPDGGKLDQSAPRPDGGSLDLSVPSPDGGKLDQSAPRLDGGKLDLSVPSPDGGKLDLSAPSPDGGKLDMASVRDSSPDNAVPAVLYRINTGSTSAPSPFASDQYYSGGTSRTTTNTITITGITNPAPAAVYQSERYGAATYTFPGLVAGATYKVRLHFAELYWTASGRRVFNAAINGAVVLSNFDIYVAAGNAGNKAVLREFNAIANASGQIVIAFTNITDNASIEGIEVTH
jgi:hypothetical protein